MREACHWREHTGCGNYELFMRCITSCYVIDVPKTVSSNGILQLLNEIGKFRETWGRGEGQKSVREVEMEAEEGRGEWGKSSEDTKRKEGG